MHNIIENGLEDYLGGAPSPEFQTHLSRCAGCRAEVEDFQRLSSLLGELRSAAPVAPPLGFAPRLVRNLQSQPKQSFWNVFSADANFTRKVAFGSLLSLLILGSYLATEPDDAMAAFDHTPEAVMASHDVSSPDNQQHLDGMLVTLSHYHQ